MKIDIHEKLDYSILQAKTFIVTGGATGIGRAIVEVLGRYEPIWCSETNRCTET
jgi:hypothetical protein